MPARYPSFAGRKLGPLLALWVFMATGCATAMAAAPGSPQAPRALTELSLEELLKVEITSASRKAQRLADTAAAVFVITQDDIRRSGATSIPEALRMAPGLHVARFGTNKWAVSARGDNGRFANKLLVLMDGRSIYTPLYSGVLWEAHDTLLEDIERIEVIRGPGAAMWGANAVNGVINIITRAARGSQGTLVSAHAGTQEHLGLAVRHGGRLGDDGHFRAYFKASEVDHLHDRNGQPSPDTMRAGRAGLRVDVGAGSGRLTVSGELHSENVGDLVTVPTLTAPHRRTTPSGGSPPVRTCSRAGR